MSQCGHFQSDNGEAVILTNPNRWISKIDFTRVPTRATLRRVAPVTPTFVQKWTCLILTTMAVFKRKRKAALKDPGHVMPCLWDKFNFHNRSMCSVDSAYLFHNTCSRSRSLRTAKFQANRFPEMLGTWLTSCYIVHYFYESVVLLPQKQSSRFKVNKTTLDKYHN